MLDTNIVSDLVRNPQGAVFRRLGACGNAVICISVITAAELRYGCAKRQSPRLTAQVETILQAIEIVPLDCPADTAYGTIRAQLGKEGRSIGPNDLLIAAHAQTVDAVLVTANTAEFSRIRSLRIENWLDAPAQ